MDKKLIQKARQADLAEYLLGMGIPLIKNGHRHKHKEHNSLVFTKNSYYWNSRQEHGNAIDYLTRHMGMDFINAVLALAPGAGQPPTQEAPSSKNFEFNQLNLNHNIEKARQYLSCTRRINNGIIDSLIKEKLLCQERQTNNIIFPMYDEDNNCVGAELQGVTSQRFKGISEHSKYGYGFNVRFSNDNTYEYALFFESAVDLISFIDYKRNYEGKSLHKCILVSMAGLKMNVLKHTIKAFAGELQVVLCIDNDTAGETFKDKIEVETDYIDCPPDKRYKDWNEQLASIKKYKKPIQRLLERGSNQNQIR